MRIYEINARTHCQDFTQITEAELSDLRRIGFDAIWLMGVWQISEGARRLSKIISDSFEGSPYAVPSYTFSPSLGGIEGFVALAERAHAAGLKVIVDFVSNHMAIDSPLIAEHPDFFIRSDTRCRRQNMGDFFLHPSGEVIAFGRDPYFPPWHDTSQLDYSSPQLRRHMTETLKWISRYADGVRCDMAMLILKEQVRQLWYPLAPAAWFDNRMPGEFWDEAISEVKSARPDFIFIAEAYWDKEPRLLGLGFDLAYEKRLYDGLSSANHHLVIERLTRDLRLLERSLCFIENHDEPRAASVFTRAGNLASMALILSLPGSVLIHEGQMEGKTERLPVQRLRPDKEEPDDAGLRRSYELLLGLTSDRPFREGSFAMFNSGADSVISFIRQDAGRAVAYMGQVTESHRVFNSLTLDLTPLARAAGAARHLRLTNLINSHSVVLEADHRGFHVQAERLGVDEQSLFSLVEATTA